MQTKPQNQQTQNKQAEVSEMTSKTTAGNSAVNGSFWSRSHVLLGVASVSFAMLLLELALTRLFSVVLFYHFAFLAISVALLGLGAGGVTAYLKKARLAQYSLSRLGCVLSVLNAIATLVVLEIILHARISLRITPGTVLRLTAIYLAAAFVFFLNGVLLSVVFARAPRPVSRLYGADLLGGALACMAAVPLLNVIGAPNAVLVSALVMALAAALWAQRRSAKLVAQVVGMFFVLLLVVNRGERVLDIVYSKGVRRNPKVEFVRWNALSRVEVFPDEQGKGIQIDGDAYTALMDTDPSDTEDAWQKTWDTEAAPSVVSVLRPHGDYAIIGPGGGVDVLRAVSGGSPSVTAVEINPIIANSIMGGAYAEYSHHLYQLPQVHVHVADGRAWLRSSTEQYDIVQMTKVDTWASTAAGALALSENSLYTMEAFHDYFAHLKPDGMLVVTRWDFAQPREALRIVAQDMETLHALGIANPAAHVMIIAEGGLDQDGQAVAVFAKKSPFSPAELQAVEQYLQSHPTLLPLYMPGKPELAHEATGAGAYAALIQGNDAPRFSEQYPFNVAPVYDSSPFFFFTLKPTVALGQLLHSSRGRQAWKNNMGILVLAFLIGLSTVAVLAFLVLPLLLVSGKPSRHLLALMYFVAIGLGYIMVEIALIQRFVVFLGHPTYAMTVVVFCMLLSSGVGSLVSRRWFSQTARIRLALIAIAAAVLVYMFVLPGLLTQYVGLPFAIRLVMSCTVLIPLGFIMGMPFPTGLRALSEKISASGENHANSSENIIEWAWAMNAGSSVLGSVVAMVVAMSSGLNAVLVCAAAAYLIAGLVARRG